MKIDLIILCPGCKKELKLENYYECAINSTTFVALPCECGITKKIYMHKLKKQKIENMRIANLPYIPIWGDHLRSTR